MGNTLRATPSGTKSMNLSSHCMSKEKKRIYVTFYIRLYAYTC